MPFVEVLAPPSDPAAKTAAARALTDAIVQGFGVGPETVSIYILPVGTADYVHAGESAQAGLPQRVFVKVHAYRRNADKRRAVVAAAARPMAEAFGVGLADVAIYFLERSPDEIAHGDKLASD